MRWILSWPLCDQCKSCSCTSQPTSKFTQAYTSVNQFSWTCWAWYWAWDPWLKDERASYLVNRPKEDFTELHDTLWHCSPSTQLQDMSLCLKSYYLIQGTLTDTLYRRRGIFSDSNIFLWDELEDINTLSLFPKFQLIPNLHFQVMHD